VTAFLERELGAGGDLLTGALARAAALSRASERCDGVLAPARVWRRPDGMVAAAFPVAEGASLAEMVARGALGTGECVTVGIGVATALAAMHAERLAHGDVSAANVIAAGGMVTLVDTMGALATEVGTAGFAAPERPRGATPPADVYALGMLLRSIADAEARPVMDAWTGPMLAEDPAERPTAAHAAAALALCAPATPLPRVAAPVAAAIRAGGTARTIKRKEDRWWRAERSALRLAPLLGLVGVAAVTGAALVPTVAAAPVSRHADGNRVDAPLTIPLATSSLDSPQAAAENLAARRVEALAAGDADALLALSLPGSPAAAADRYTAKALAEGTLDFRGLELESVTARERQTTPGGAIVEVTSTLSGYSVGQEAVPAGEATAVLELVLTQRGWLVARILPPP
jgi:hypothetical protein